MEMRYSSLIFDHINVETSSYILDYPKFVDLSNQRQLLRSLFFNYPYFQIRIVNSKESFKIVCLPLGAVLNKRPSIVL